ncbi:HAD family hydrolase [uncultured Erythrobacter sp.]|uniref:HAD family hydrolase n=1 Tax=uncultured Erythrobacter sp. TaxID=263913 RepID=UPI002619F434|nr:HAD family hydrolase [uncultured Erythrobacter sp.]
MTETILPHEMPHALERGPANMKVLSLDCFDTLLWRDCHAPTDVFAGLPDLSIAQRVRGEANARKQAATLHQRSEVGLADIYAHSMPSASPEAREAAIAEELAAEARACFGFEPTIALMRAAKAAGHKVMIVSDTYLDADQLRQLIADAAGAEVAALIDNVFASSQEGVSKTQGMLACAIKAMKCRAAEVLHIGDNKAADFDAARALGIPALHLLQFSEHARQRMRFERSCQQLAGDEQSGVRGLMPHRPLLAAAEPREDDPAGALGASVLGPVFHGFDQWLRAEAEAIEAERGGTVHWLFMLRDGHLPHLIHQTGDEAPSTARVEISRFVAIGASLTTREAYRQQWTLEFGLNPATLARQMLFEGAEVAKIVGNPRTDADRVAASHRLRAELKKGQREKLTRRRSRARAERLIAHIRAAVDPQKPIAPGDTLMLVDLGYNGSAQDRVDALLAEAFDCHVAGRYLLLREMSASGLDKKGLIDARHYDAEMLEALCANVAVIEQLATCELGSVVDFSEVGDPIRKQSAVKGAQSDVRGRVQAGAVRFAQAAQHPPINRETDTHAERGWREAALGVLTRFMFLPLPQELEVLKSFEHDVNLGSERMVALFDPDHSAEGMRRRGLFYMKGSARMFLPAELAGEDINTRLSLLVQKRFGLSLSYTDSSFVKIAVPAFYLGEKDSARLEVEAEATHQGYYTVRLPIAPGARGIALQVGSVFEWLELSSVTLSEVATLKGDARNDETPARLEAQFDAMTEHAEGIFECTDPAAFMLVNPPAQSEGGKPQMIEITLRPLRLRPVGQRAHQASSSSQPATRENQMKDAAA